MESLKRKVWRNHENFLLIGTFNQIIFNHWTPCEYITHTQDTNAFYLSIMMRRTRINFKWKKGRFGIMENTDLLFGIHPAHCWVITGRRWWGFKEGDDKKIENKKTRPTYWIRLSKDNCQQQKPYEHEIYFSDGALVGEKKATNKEKVWELMKDILSLLTKSPSGLGSVVWRAFLYASDLSTQNVPYFTKLVMLQFVPSDKFISSASTFLMDSWIECNKRLSH